MWHSITQLRCHHMPIMTFSIVCALSRLAMESFILLQIVQKMYEKEMETEQARLDRLKSGNADASDIRQQENVLAETRMMIPDCRLQSIVNLSSLFTYVDTYVFRPDQNSC